MLNVMSMILSRFSIFIAGILEAVFLLSYDENDEVYATIRSVVLFFFILSLSVAIYRMFSERRNK